MKTKLLSMTLLVAATAIFIGHKVYQTSATEMISGMALANVEALASGESDIVWYEKPIDMNKRLFDESNDSTIILITKWDVICPYLSTVYVGCTPGQYELKVVTPKGK